MPYTNIAKPTGASYTNISKPTSPVSVVGTIRAGMTTGLMIPLTYAVEYEITTGEEPYTSVSKPTGAVYTNILKPT